MKTRKTARVVLLNDRDEVCLFLHIGKFRSYWVLPGGGVEDGESWEDAALRELWEETGISGVPVGPLLWTRQARQLYNGHELLADERYYLIRCGMQTVTNENQLEEEKRHYTRNEWWSLSAIRASSDTFYPERLADLLVPVVQNRISLSPLSLPE